MLRWNNWSLEGNTDEEGDKFTTEFKAKVALETIKGQQPIHELAREYDVHPNQIPLWKKQLVDGASEVFRRGRDPNAVAQAEELDRAYRQVGRLQIEVDWLKKSSDIWPDGGGEALYGGAGSSQAEHRASVGSFEFDPFELLPDAANRGHGEPQIVLTKT